MLRGSGKATRVRRCAGLHQFQMPVACFVSLIPARPMWGKRGADTYQVFLTSVSS